MIPDREVAVQHSIRTAALRGDIRARLRPVCAEWPEETFELVVRQLADITLKYEGHVAGKYDVRSTDALVANMKAILGRSEDARKARETPQSGLAQRLGNIPRAPRESIIPEQRPSPGRE